MDQAEQKPRDSIFDVLLAVHDNGLLILHQKTLGYTIHTKVRNYMHYANSRSVSTGLTIMMFMYSCLYDSVEMISEIC